MSLDLIGAVSDTARPKAVVIRVIDPVGLAASQGGALGGLAAKAMPQFIESQVLQKVIKGFGEALDEDQISRKFFQAQVVDDPGPGAVASLGSDMWVGAALGALGVAVAVLLKALVLG